MLDWKILAASMVALLVISSLFIGGGGVRDSLSSILDKISEYLGTSPFSGFLTSDNNVEAVGDKPVSLLLSPDTLSLVPDEPATLTFGDTIYTDFQGIIILSFENKDVTLKTDSVQISFPLTRLDITLTLNSLELENTRFHIEPDLSTDEGSLSLVGFQGEAIATPEGLQLDGTATSLRVSIGDLEFELV